MPEFERRIVNDRNLCKNHKCFGQQLPSVYDLLFGTCVTYCSEHDHLCRTLYQPQTAYEKTIKAVWEEVMV